MGTISPSKEARLFWVGRYIERTYTTIRGIKPLYDACVAGNEADFAGYCHRLGIANVYQNTEDFVCKYVGDEKNPNSIVSSLNAAYDNAILLRETIGVETLTYIHMAMQAMEQTEKLETLEMELQWVMDDIMAFRGSCCEQIEDDICRNIINTGTSVERVDLYLRFGYNAAACKRELGKLLNRLYKSQMTPNHTKLNKLVDYVLDKEAPMLSVREQILCVEGLFPNV